MLGKRRKGQVSPEKRVVKRAKSRFLNDCNEQPREKKKHRFIMDKNGEY